MYNYSQIPGFWGLISSNWASFYEKPAILALKLVVCTGGGDQERSSIIGEVITIRPFRASLTNILDQNE